METNLKSLKVTRGSLKSRLTTFKKFLEKFDTEDFLSLKTLADLEYRLSAIEAALFEFNSIQLSIEQESKDEDIPGQYEIRDAFESSAFEAIATAKVIIDKGNETYRPVAVADNSALQIQTNINTNTTTTASSSAATNLTQNIKLPSINLPSFDGSPDSWLEFVDLFTALIHENNKIQTSEKFYYLRAALKGEAAEIIHSISTNSANYIVAWDMLCSRYQNNELMVDVHVTKLFQLPAVPKENATALRNLVDSANKHVRCLKNLGEPVEHWDTLIIHIICSKLDYFSRKDWELRRGILNRAPAFSDLVEFLKMRWEVLDKLNYNRADKHFTRSNKVAQKTVTNYSTKRECPNCNEPFHPLYFCKTFQDASVEQRNAVARRLKLCLNCFRDSHKTNQCKNELSCRKCNKRHNTMLHLDNAANQSEQIAGNTIRDENVETNNETNVIVAHLATRHHQVLLSTALVKVKDINDKFQYCRAFLDPGSQASYITTELATKLGLHCDRKAMQISGVNGTRSKAYSETSCYIYSRVNDFKTYIHLLVLPKITENLPQITFNKNELKIPTNIALADPEFNISNPIDILIGADLCWSLVCNQSINLGRNKPACRKTKLGWIIGGPLAKPASTLQTNTTLCNSAVLERLLSKFWDVETVTTERTPYTPEETEAETCFHETTKRTDSGRFIVKIPLKGNTILGESKPCAERRFYALERKLQADAQLNQNYCEFIREYINLNHMTVVNPDSTLNSYYMPHHAVTKEESLSTKLRVVFDASAKTSNGVSFNEVQLTGPTIQSDLISILLRFRLHKYILSADISKMYRQILVTEGQRSLQKILWREGPHQELKTYQLNTVTYGTTSAPFLSTRCLQQLAIEARETYPEESIIIEQDFYIDDLLTGSNDIKKLEILKTNITTILQRGGFPLRKFLCNTDELPSHSEPNDNSDPLLHLTSIENKTLGIRWNSKKDTFHFHINPSLNHQQIWSKRTILSATAQIFDPLGIVSPIIIIAKLVMQQLWKIKIPWDEAIPSKINGQWEKFVQDINKLEEIEIPRHATKSNAQTHTLHGFSDASERAYGACVYLRTECKGSQLTSVHLLASKSRVAPLKQITLPRLELCGAVLLNCLISRVRSAISKTIRIEEVYCWTDSMIVLSWLDAPCNRWKTFVANRVADIQTNTDLSWNHVRSTDNPADLITRGTSVSGLTNCKLWWNGPHWLSCEKIAWPQKSITVNIDETEARKITLAVTVNDRWNIFETFSNYKQLQRVMAYVLRFIANSKSHKDRRIMNILTQQELKGAHLKLIQLSQNDTFPDEVRKLRKQKQLLTTSRILPLAPFLDESGTLRVGGRLEHSTYDYEHKHPIILDSKHTLTKLIARQEHIRLLHCGAQALLYSLRQGYWPISGRNLTRQICNQCTICFRTNPKSANPLMGNIPAARITPAPPFSYCGTDFAGPIQSRDRKGRGCRTIKLYLCLFVCFTTKAYHIEIVSDLSTDNFIACFKRFIARRGTPTRIHSDNGTNYVGADHEIKRIYQVIKQSETKMQEFFRDREISWSFIPAQSPHFGGLWETGIRAIKTYLRKIIGNALLTYEELSTVVTQIESILNSRPLSPMSNDPNDTLPLTPAHFLIGRPLTALPENDMCELQTNKLDRYQRCQQLMQHFWKRWHFEYINQLQTRSKWRSQPQLNNEMTKGALVLIKEDNTPPLKWKLARIIELHPGSDGIKRVATIQLATKAITKRPVHKLCPLPIA